MPHAVTHKDTQPIASSSRKGHVHFLFSPRAMEALRTSTVPSVAKTPNDSPGRSYMRIQRHPIHVQRADGVVDDETDVVRMPRREADGPFQADVHDVDWSCSSSPPRGTATPQSW